MTGFDLLRNPAHFHALGYSSTELVTLQSILCLDASFSPLALRRTKVRRLSADR